MYRLSLAISLLCWVPSVSAEVTVIYRTSDRTVAGWVRPPQSVAKEVDNLTHSAGFAGTTPNDFATVTVSDATWAANRGKEVAVTPTGQVQFVDSPAGAKRRLLLQGIQTKLGLTDAELSVLAK